MNDINFIKGEISPSELFCQLAEEAAELAQAALKIHRVCEGSNPPPFGLEEAYEKFLEEMADVDLVMDALDFNDPEMKLVISFIKIKKLDRWVKRLKGSEAAK